MLLLDQLRLLLLPERRLLGRLMLLLPRERLLALRRLLHHRRRLSRGRRNLSPSCHGSGLLAHHWELAKTLGKSGRLVKALSSRHKWRLAQTRRKSLERLGLRKGSHRRLPQRQRRLAAHRRSGSLSKRAHLGRCSTPTASTPTASAPASTSLSIPKGRRRVKVKKIEKKLEKG